VKLVPLFHALNSAETLMHRVAAEPLNAYAHPHPEAKTWPVKATWTQALEIVRFSEGYRLYAAREIPFCAAAPGRSRPTPMISTSSRRPCRSASFGPTPVILLAPAGHPADDITELVVRTFTAFATGR
jgi:multidrug resistance protein MdtO